MAALAHLTAMNGGNAKGLQEQSLPCAMDSDEPMDTDEPWAGTSSQEVLFVEGRECPEHIRCVREAILALFRHQACQQRLEARQARG